MKSLTLIRLAAILCASFALVSCNIDNTQTSQTSISEGGKYSPLITLTIPGSSSSSSMYSVLDNPWAKAYKEEIGVELALKWEEPNASSEERSLDEYLSSGIVPDILPGLGRDQFEFMVNNGLAADLTELIDKYATPLTKEILYSDGGYAVTSSTIDGRIYALPYVYGNLDNVAMMWIRQDWLDNLELEVPTNDEELQQILNAFVYNDPDGNGKNDTSGLCSNNDLWPLGSVFNMFGAQPFWSWYYDESGTLKYSTISHIDQIKKSLDYLKSLYNDGLLYPEFAVLSKDEYYDILQKGKAGIAFEYKFFPTHLQSDLQQVTKAEWKAYPIPTALEDNTPAKPFSYHGPAAYNVISSDCKNPEAAIYMLNVFCEKLYGARSDENIGRYVIDENGVDLLQFAPISTSKANDLSTFVNVAQAVENNKVDNLNALELSKYERCIDYINGNQDYWQDYLLYGPHNASVDVARNYTDESSLFFSHYYTSSSFSPTTKQNLALLDSKWRTACIRIIMGNSETDYYDAFVKEWYELGGTEIENEANEIANSEKEGNK